MAEERPFEDLMARLRQGDERAAEAVWERFARRLTALAAARLPGLLRPKADAEDVVQSVFRSFFARQADGRLQADSWDGLWTLLTVLAVRKCGHRVKHFRAARRDVRREADVAGTGSTSSAWEATAPEPTPAEAVLLADTLEEVMRDLEPRHRRIVGLRLEGYTIEEVARQAGCTERSVHRVLEKARARLEALADQDGP
jgi:RNA polymerase sigma-70 factor (ECF subfamily)